MTPRCGSAYCRTAAVADGGNDLITGPTSSPTEHQLYHVEDLLVCGALVTLQQCTKLATKSLALRQHAAELAESRYCEHVRQQGVTKETSCSRSPDWAQGNALQPAKAGTSNRS